MDTFEQKSPAQTLCRPNNAITAWKIGARFAQAAAVQLHRVQPALSMKAYMRLITPQYHLGLLSLLLQMGDFAIFTDEHDGAHQCVQGSECQMMQALLSSLFLQESADSQGLISAPIRAGFKPHRLSLVRQWQHGIPWTRNPRSGKQVSKTLLRCRLLQRSG